MINKQEYESLKELLELLEAIKSTRSPLNASQTTELALALGIVVASIFIRVAEDNGVDK